MLALFYQLSFYLLSTCCAFLYFCHRPRNCESTTSNTNHPNPLLGGADVIEYEAHKKLNKLHVKYLIAYSLATLGDWLQGPYLYALYQKYGLDRGQIQSLFVAGFTASMVTGTFVGHLADKYGRRLNCCLYCVLYAACCLTKHSRNFSVLFVGRILGGIATSILWSAFESWIVYQHTSLSKTVHPLHIEKYLKRIFANATVGNTLMAILAGLVSQHISDKYGMVATFDFATLSLLLALFVISLFWEENYGNQIATSSEQLNRCWNLLKSDSRILFLGLIQACFEAGMYSFVLEWTPALEVSSFEDDGESSFDFVEEKLPHGTVFSSFMVSIMMGTWFYSKWINQPSHGPIERLLLFILMVSTCCMIVPPITSNRGLRFIAFCIFECCIGIFWPAISTLRSVYIPEDIRSTMMNVFRVPLNFLVVMVLIPNLALPTVFLVCSFLLFLSVLLASLLYQETQTTPIQQTRYLVHDI